MASSRNTPVASGKKAPAKPAPKPWTIADDKGSTSYVDRILGIRGKGAADVAGKHTKDTLASTVQTLRGYNEKYGYCTENELAHMWYLDNVSGAKPETRAKLDAILNTPNISKEQKLRMAYTQMGKDLPDEERKKLLADKEEIDRKFAKKKSAPADERAGKGKKAETHERIIKKCKIPKYFFACVSKGETIPFSKQAVEGANNALGTQIDVAFIAQFENGKGGGSAATGYIPWGQGARNNSSGVTVGAGFDLGAHNAQDLKKMGIAEDTPLYAKLKPYLRLQGQAACDKLAADMVAGTAPRLTAEEVEFIDQSVFKDKISDFQKKWDAKAAAINGKKFAELDPRLQTALFSRAYQSGGARLDSFIDAGVKGEWEAVQKEYDRIIKTSPTNYRTRLMAEKQLVADTVLEKRINIAQEAIKKSIEATKLPK